MPVLLSDIKMLVFSGGLERTNAECDVLPTRAAIERRRVQPVAPPYGVLEGLAR